MFPKTKTKFDFNYTLPPMVEGITSIDDIKRISPFFNETSPVTYAVFLQANKNKLSQTEIERTQNLIQHLSNKEKETYEAVSKYLKNREEYESIIDKIEDGLDNHIEKKLNETA